MTSPSRSHQNIRFFLLKQIYSILCSSLLLFFPSSFVIISCNLYIILFSLVIFWSSVIFLVIYSEKGKFFGARLCSRLILEDSQADHLMGSHPMTSDRQQLHSPGHVEHGLHLTSPVESCVNSCYGYGKYFPSAAITVTESAPVVGHISRVSVPESSSEHLESSSEGLAASSTLKDVHISADLMEEFMELAKSNTEKDLETCGILGASLKNETFYVTTLIIPKQETSSNSCQAQNEEEIHAVLAQQSLFPLGWIHTHPSQTCFLSSIDLHTQYSYQDLNTAFLVSKMWASVGMVILFALSINTAIVVLMLQEAVAIVMAPTDATRRHGIFRLTDPGGISVLRECQDRGFHPHREPTDNTPIYESCSHVCINPNLRFEIIDLRSPS